MGGRLILCRRSTLIVAWMPRTAHGFRQDRVPGSLRQWFHQVEIARSTCDALVRVIDLAKFMMVAQDIGDESN